MPVNHKEPDLSVVFVHGILGFATIRLAWKTLHYFRHVKSSLQDLGVALHFPVTPAVGTVAQRAEALGEQIARIRGGQLCLIAHSMGGLDSRLCIQQHDPQRRIKHLTTIATPHHGTPLADRMLHSNNPFYALLRRLTRPGLEDLTQAACRTFNTRVADREDVCYESYAGHRRVAEMPPLYRPWTRFLDSEAGDNDSQVPVASARWGEFRGLLRADHPEMVGWSLGFPNRATARPFDHLHFYHELIARKLENIKG